MNRILLNEVNANAAVTFAERPDVEFFMLREEIGRGASCIVYHAVGSDNTEHLLKEYYPKHLELQRDGSGNIVVPADKAKAFEQGLIRFRTGCDRQKSVRLSNEGLKNFTCNVQGYYKANGTEYIDMTCFNGQTYDHVQEKSVYNLMLRMRTLAQVIGNYHKAGLLHLDIKPENIFVRPESETVEDVMLFDFDSVTPISELAATKALSCTKTWCAPEQLLHEKRSSICPATDLFAIGEIVFVQLFGRHSEKEERRSFVTRYSYDYNAEIFKDMNPKVFPLLDDLLHHTICGVVGKRYRSSDELIAKLDEIIKIAHPEIPYLKSSLPAVQDFFVGRENEIKDIHQKLSENDILFLHGIGGIGKSELAKRYALEHKNDYDTIIFVPYVSNVNTLLRDDNSISLYHFSPHPEEKQEEYCIRKLHKLRELCDERTLFIVDNLDREDDPDLKKLFGLDCKMLITTRIDFSEYGYGRQLSLGALCDRDSIRKIFNKHYTKPLTAEENDCVEQIIDRVAGHTMIMEILAKQMMAGRVKPNKMLAKLQEGGIFESGKERVHSGKDGVLSAQSVSEHIQALFDLSEINEDERYILADLSLIPYTGISTELFYDWCELQDYECINNLVVKGWVRLDKHTDYVSLHPLIGDLVSHLVGYTHEPYKKMAQNALKYVKDCKFTDLSAEGLTSLLQIIQSLLKNICTHGAQTEATADFLCKVSACIKDYIELSSVEACYKKALSVREQLFGEEHKDVAASHRYLALLYNDIGNYKQAENHCRKSLDILAILYGKDSVQYALAAKTLGGIYKFSGKLAEAEAAYRGAADTFCKVKGNDSSQYYNCLFLLGDLYTAAGKYDLAEELLQKNLSYCTRKGFPNKISSAHHVLNVMYHRKGLYFEAVKHGQLALEFAKEAYGKVNANANASISICYNALGNAYLGANDFCRAKECFEKSLEMCLILYGETHRRTALIYFRMGLLFEQTGDIQNAKVHYQKAWDIRKVLFGDDNDDTLEAAEKALAMNAKLQ